MIGLYPMPSEYLNSTQLNRLDGHRNEEWLLATELVKSGHYEVGFEGWAMLVTDLHHEGSIKLLPNRRVYGSQFCFSIHRFSPLTRARYLMLSLPSYVLNDPKIRELLGLWPSDFYLWNRLSVYLRKDGSAEATCKPMHSTWLPKGR